MITIELYRDKRKRHRARIVASNGKVVWATSEGDGYSRKRGAREAVQSLCSAIKAGKYRVVTVALAFLLALPCSAAIKVKWGGSSFNIQNPDAALWSQSEIAQSGVTEQGPFWPKIAKGKQVHDCQQMRVRGESGDRTSRNYLVVCRKSHVSSDHGPNGLLKPDTKYLKRVDPYQARAPLPVPPVLTTPVKPLNLTAKSFTASEATPPKAYPPGSVVVYVVKTNNFYHAWAIHPATERWAMQVTTTLSPPDWFTPPGYIDENGKVSVTVPTHKGQGHFFRAKRWR